MYGSMEPWNLYKNQHETKFGEPWFHRMVEHVEPQVDNLLLRNNAHLRVMLKTTP